MAMAVAVAGFSAQGAPFKPSRHPLFLLSSSPFRLSTSASSSMGASIGQKNSSLQGRNCSSTKSGVILTCPFFVKVSSHEKRKALHFLRMTLGSAILNANRNYGVFFLGCSLGIDQPKEWGGSSPSGINCWNAATKEVIAFKQSIQAATLHQQSVENSTIESATKNDTLCNDIQDKWEFEAFNMSNLRSQHYHELHGNVLSSQMLPRINYQCMLQFSVGNVGTDGLVNGGLLEETKFSFPEVADEADDFPGQLVMGNKDIPPKKVNDENEDPDRKSVHKVLTSTTGLKSTTLDLKERLLQVYDKVLVVDNISLAKEVVNKLTTQYEDLVHACDTEVAKIDVKDETPVDHGEIICFSVYSGPQADYFGKSCIWVDVLDGGRDVLMEFASFFGSASIKKVWHNYSFDYHIIENYGIKVSGFYADTMHLARLWDSSRRILGGYSLEALTGDPKVMDGGCTRNSGDLLSGKISMKSIFGRKKIKKDGSEGKLTCVAPVEELQREERIPWICYSALDSISTLSLFESLKAKLSSMKWVVNGQTKGVMYQFYKEYLRPFGKLLVEMESVGMLVDRAYLADMEKLAISEQNVAANRFRKWASKYCPDAAHMNVGSDAQLRQLFFGGIVNCKNPDECLPLERGFKVPNVDKVVEEGKKVPLKHRTIKLRTLWEVMPTDMFTASGWPSVSGDALKIMAGKVSAEEFGMGEDFSNNLDDVSPELSVDDFEKSDDPGSECGTIDKSSYGTAYEAFGGGKEGKEACHAIAALCEVCSIDSLISNFILPLQGSHISGNDDRIHCSLNINTETGRLSARRPNLQNQPALEKDRYRIRQAFIAAPGKSLIVADYGQLELRILAHLAGCKSMLDAFKAGGDFHSQTAMNMYPYILDAVKDKRVLLEWDAQLGEEKPPVPLLKDAFASERRKAKMLNFSIAYGKTPVGLSRDWKVSVQEARRTVDLWYKDRQEVLKWQEERKKQALTEHCVYTLLGRSRRFPSTANASKAQKGHIERAAINTPVQGSAADVAMCAMLEISRNTRLKELGWKLLLQVHDEVILEGPTESAEVAKAIVVECMSKPFYGQNFLKVGLAVDAKCAQNWYAAK